MRLAGALGQFWFTRGHYREGFERLSIALSRPKSAERTPARAKALNAALRLEWGLGEFATSAELAGEALAIATELHEPLFMAAALDCLAVSAAGEQRYEEARSLLERAVTLLREANLLQDFPQVIFRMGQVAHQLGNYETARRSYQEARSLLAGKGVDIGSAVLRFMGHIAPHDGDTMEARSLFCESLMQNQAMGDNAGVMRCIAAFAGLAVAQQRPLPAARLLGAVEALQESIRLPLLWIDQNSFDQSVAQLRGRLDPQVLDAAWAEGRAMTMEQAIAEAMRPPVTDSSSRSALHGPDDLSPREREVLSLVTQGLSDAQVAEKLIVSPRTVNAHLTTIYRKLGVTSRSAATRYALDHKLV